MSSPIRVAVIDPEALHRADVVAALNVAPIELVAQGANVVDALHICEDLKPDIVVLSVGIQGDGIVATRTISAACPAIKIVILTLSEREEHVRSALTAGARAYILKQVSRAELIEALKAVQRGERRVTPTLAARLLRCTTNNRVNGAEPCLRRLTAADDLLPTGLTGREDQILARVARGLSNKEIARELRVSDKTIKHHMTNIMQKLNVRNRLKAAILAISFQEKKNLHEDGRKS